jgi:hypothetical protein
VALYHVGSPLEERGRIRVILSHLENVVGEAIGGVIDDITQLLGRFDVCASIEVHFAVHQFYSETTHF